MMTFLESNSNNESQESLDGIEDQNTSDVSFPSEASSNQDCEMPPSTSRTRKSTSPTPFEKELLKSVKQRKLEDTDEDMSFFMSIMPTLKKINAYQKLIFRTKVMEHLIEVEKEKVITMDDLYFINTQIHDENQDTESQ